MATDSSKGEKRIQGLFTLTRQVRQAAAPFLIERGFSNADILENWQDILGADLSRGIAPIRLTFPKNSGRGGTLHVKSAGGAFAVVCSHQKERIISRINAYFGYTAVSDLKIVQGLLKLPKPKMTPIKKSLSKKQQAALEEKTALIDDPDLKALTVAIGQAVFGKK